MVSYPETSIAPSLRTQTFLLARRNSCFCGLQMLRALHLKGIFVIAASRDLTSHVHLTRLLHNGLLGVSRKSLGVSVTMRDSVTTPDNILQVSRNATYFLFCMKP